jgi:asparagine synthase (glutamine-hydrolysing)
MCGIAGVAKFADAPTIEMDTLRAMCDALQHRGPDEEGVHIQSSVALGMRRLAIIDVAEGHQPYFNEDRSIRCVFNGEIYNFRELREELAIAGHHFNSAADGEVLVHLWEAYGPDFLTRLNGMFAIALHDVVQQRMLLARDHIGIKPLFYAADAKGIVFGSEIKALLASGHVARELDIDMVGQFIAWEYVPAPGTLFRAIRKLPAGSMLDIDLRRGTVEQKRYWDVLEAARQLGNVPATYSDQVAAVDTLIHDAVQRQMISDVPLGAFLSGGVDSSLIVAAMGSSRTFSIGFDDPTYNELDWSERVAQHLGVSHRTQIIEPHVVDLFDTLMHHMDDPIGDFSIFPTYLVSQLAREEVTVVLSGDGGDELFGGYETYIAQLHADRWRRLPGWIRKLVEPMILSLRPRPAKKGVINKARRFIEGVQLPAELGHARWRLFTSEALQQALFTEGALRHMSTPAGAHVLELAGRAHGCDPITAALYVDMNSYLVDNCLVKVDRMSMACSLEARVPLLDPEVAALAFALPDVVKATVKQTKILLKKVATRHVPRECVYRPKEGFSIPIKAWLSTDFRPLLEDLLRDDILAAEGLLRVDTIKRLKREHLQGHANHSHILWGLLVFQEWRRRWNV